MCDTVFLLYCVIILFDVDLVSFVVFFFFFFKQKTAYEMRISDWSSDVCSSDLPFAHGIDAMIGAARIDRPLDRGLEEIPFRRGDALAGGCIRHLADDRHRHGDGRLLVVSVERETPVGGVTDEMLLADIDIPAPHLLEYVAVAVLTIAGSDRGRTE